MQQEDNGYRGKIDSTVTSRRGYGLRSVIKPTVSPVNETCHLHQEGTQMNEIDLEKIKAYQHRLAQQWLRGGWLHARDGPDQGID